MPQAARYLELLQIAPARRLVAAIAAACLSWGMLPLGILLAAEDATGSFATAGAVLAAFGATAGVSAPFRGRLVDRRGARRFLPALAAACAIALTALAIVCGRGGPVWVLAALSGLGGLVAPPLVAYGRSVWPLAVEPRLVRRGYAVTSLLNDVGQVAGPALAGAVFLVLGAAVLPLCAAVALGASLLAVATAGKAGGRPPRPMPRLLGSRALLALLAVSTLLGAALGLVQVAVPAIAKGWDSEALSGPLLATFALGSVAGALWFGARTWRAPAVVRYLTAALALGLLVALPAVATRPLELAPLLLVAGLAYGPAVVSMFESLDVLAPGSGAEGLAWFTTAEGAGWAAGSAVSGLLVARVGTEAPFLAAAALLVVPAAVLLVLARRVSRRRS